MTTDKKAIIFAVCWLAVSIYFGVRGADLAITMAAIVCANIWLAVASR